MSALDHKLGRDLVRLASQGVTIALVVACGIASFTALQASYGSLIASRDVYYEQRGMPDLFANVTRAPDALLPEVAALPGVSVVESRVEGAVKVLLPDVLDPPSGRILSIPDRVESRLPQLVLREGRMPDAERDDEVLVIESFARGQSLGVGDELELVVLGTSRRTRIVGIAMSPEYVMALPAGDFTPDPARVAILWMRRRALAPLLELDGAFSSVVVDVDAGANARVVAASIERILAPYGGATVIERSRQSSDAFLTSELNGLEAMATVVPFIFLGVSAFLVHVVLSRLLQVQRSQIAMLRAIGYSRAEVARHFLALVSLIVLAGALLGLYVGHRLGIALTDLYAEYFHFPSPLYSFDSKTAALGVGLSLGSAILGAIGTILSVTKLPPAVAMQPPTPDARKSGWLDRLGLHQALGPVLSMILRELQRRPARALLSAVGIAFAGAIVVVGRFGADAMTNLLEYQFHVAMREDITVSFQEAAAGSAVSELARVPGVIRAEGVRIAPARVRNGAAYRDVAVQAFDDDTTLRRIVDRYGNVSPMPREGLLATKALAELLGVQVGDSVEIEWLEGERRIVHAPLTMLVDEPIGLQIYASQAELDRMLREQHRVSSVLLRVDPAHEAEVLEDLRTRPLVGASVRRREILDRFTTQSASQQTVFSAILSIFAAIIAIGVVYNNARVSLSMRERDLASLRVLGFTRAEISAILLGELASHVAIGTPLGMYLGRDWSERLASTASPEAYRLAVQISPTTYGIACGVILAASIASALLVRRKLDALDLVSVLKTRE